MADKETKADWIDVCPACKGSGAHIVMGDIDRPSYPNLNPSPCPVCGGTGRRPKAKI